MAWGTRHLMMVIFYSLRTLDLSCGGTRISKRPSLRASVTISTSRGVSVKVVNCRDQRGKRVLEQSGFKDKAHTLFSLHLG